MPGNRRLKISLLFLFVFLFLSAGRPVLALEINYPQVPGADPPQVFIDKIQKGEIPSEQALPLYVKYFYNLFLGIAGLVAFSAITAGGVRYLISAGEPGKIILAKEQISGGVFGLITLLSSFLILNTINPQLTILEMSGLNKFVLPKVTQPPASEKSVPIYFQVPVGKIIEKSFFESNAQRMMAEAKTAAKETKADSEHLNKLMSDLQKLTAACQCGASVCGADCGEEGCQGQCDKAAIDKKTEEIQSSIEELKNKRADVLAYQKFLSDRFLEIRKAGLLTSLPSGVIDYNQFIMFKYYYGLSDPGEKVEIETLPGWKDIEIVLSAATAETTPDPLTFYFNKAGNEDAISWALRDPYLNSPFPSEVTTGQPLPSYQSPGPAPSNLVEMAKIVSSKTGIRAAFILALTKTESGWNPNPGVSYLPYKSSICYCKNDSAWQTNVCDSLESIAQEIGADLASINVSAPSAGAGCGGAMGLGQIMPFTWQGLKFRIPEITGKYPPSPWDPFDSMAATGHHLIDKYVGFRETTPLNSCETEKRLVLRYFGCNPYDLSWCPAPDYGERVVKIAEDIAVNENLERCQP